jgi:hypothetical protein
MRYYRVTWTSLTGAVQYSDPLTTWTSAEMYRRAIGRDASILTY